MSEIVLVGGGQLGYTNSHVNMANFRQQGLQTYGGRQYLAFYNNSRHLCWAHRATLGATFTVVVLAILATLPSDAHNIWSFAIDGAGYFWSAWDMHNDPMKLYCGTAPLDLAIPAPMTLPIVPGNAANELSVTYPALLALTSGNVILFYRNGGAGDGNTILYHSVSGSQNMLGRQLPFFDGQSTNSLYYNTVVQNPATGRLHFSFLLRSSVELRYNHNVYYCYSDDEGVTWYNVEGELLTMPLTEATCNAKCLAWLVPINTGLNNSRAMTFDDDDNPIVCMYWGSAPGQYHLVWWDGAAWNERQAGTLLDDFSFVPGEGDLDNVPISNGLPLFKDGVIYIYYRSWALGPGVWCFRSDDFFATYTNTQIEDTYNQSWGPTLDQARWNDDQVVEMPWGRVKQDPTAPSIGAQPVGVIQLDLAPAPPVPPANSQFSQRLTVR